MQFESGQIYHVYNRGCNREPIFVKRQDYLQFLVKLRKYVADASASVLAYCLMPNHYHLLLQLRRDELGPAMHRLGVSYSKAFNLRESRVGPLFQGPFQAIHVDGDGYLLELTRYIHTNPLKAGLVDDIESWEFSSYPEYVGLRGGTLPDPKLILEMIGSPERYREFMHCRDDEGPSGFEKLLPEDEEA